MSADVNVEFGADTSGVERGTRRVRDSISSLGPDVEKISSRLGQMAGAFVSGLVAGKIWEFAQAVGDAAERTDQLAQITGLSASEIRAWGAIAQANGQTIESVSTSVGKLEQAFVKATAGGKEQQAAFRSLGIELGTVKNANDALLTIADRFSKMEDGPRKLAAAQALMGRSGKEMIPILNQGADAIRTQITAATDLGAVWGRTGAEQDAFEKKGQDLDNAFDTLGLTMSGLGNMLVDALAPAFVSCVTALSDMVAAMIKSYREGGTMKIVMETLVVIFKGVAIAGAAVGSTLVQSFQWAVAGALLAVGAVDGLSKALNKMLSGDFGGMWKSWEDSMSRATRLAGERVAAAKQNAIDTSRFISGIVSGSGASPAFSSRGRGGFDTSGGDTSAQQEQAAKRRLQAQLEELTFRQEMERDNFQKVMELEDQKLALLKAHYGMESQEYQRELRVRLRLLEQHNQEELRYAQQKSDQSASIQMDELQTIRQIQQQKMQDEIAALEQAVQMGIITEQEKAARVAEIRDRDYQDQLGLEDAVYQIRLQSLQDQLSMENIRLDEKRRINSQIEQLEAQHQNAMRKIRSSGDATATQSTREAASATFNHWKSVLTPLGNTFGQVTQGLLMRTMSWRDAFLNIGSTMLSQFIGWCTQMGINWIAKELAQTAATTAGAATRTGVEVAAQTTTKSVTAGTALFEMGINAARAAMGAYAAIAAIPFVGPFLAPAAAAAALAGVYAIGRSIFSAEGGWGEVPSDGAPTVLHRKEMVLPASIASPLRAAIASGDVGGGQGGSQRRGGDTHLHVHALDSRDVSRFLSRNPSAVRDAVSKMVRDGKVGG